MLQDDIHQLLSSLLRVAELQGDTVLSEVLSQASVELDQIDHDNWNGGTDIYGLTLKVPPESYVKIETDLEAFEQRLQQRLALLTRGYSNEHLAQITILPDHRTHRPTIPHEQPSFWKPHHLRVFLSHISTQWVYLSSRCSRSARRQAPRWPKDL